jgi:hypothetical protein
MKEDEMRSRMIVCLLLCLSTYLAPASAQVQTGEIFGKVTDSSGAVLPGVTVTIESPALLQTQSMTTTSTGAYRFPSLPLGVYSVRFELSGFSRYVRRDVRIETGFSAEVSPLLQVSTVQEEVVVSGETPVIDTKSTTLSATFNQEMLEKLPSARDPWVILEQMPGMVMDRQNVGGSESGQQSSFIAHGSGINQSWNLNGATVTDMRAVSSPMYFDFDSIAEIQIQTGGGDASLQSGGAAINLVTKSGSNVLKGSSRLFYVNSALQANNLTDELREQEAGAGNPIQDIKEYGVEIGGPVLRNRLFAWGGVGRSDIGNGVIGFLKPGATDPNDPDSLERDLTVLKQVNAKADYQWNASHKSGVYYNFNDKTRNARGVSPTVRIEAAFKQTSPSHSVQGSHQWVASDRLLLEGKYTYNQNHFVLDFTSPELEPIQGALEINTGVSYRSGRRDDNDRPSNEARFDGNYLLSNVLGGDHTFKFGTSWRHTPSIFTQHYGGYVTARFRGGVSDSADMRRDGYQKDDMTAYSVYLNDSFRRGRLTLNVGVRTDYWNDKALATSTDPNPIIPDKLPSLVFGGADSGVTYLNTAPRFGVTYDLTGRGRTILKGSLARYYGIGIYTSDDINPAVASRVRYAWNDLNRDGFVQRDELDLSRIINSAGYNATNPASAVSANIVDPNLGNDITDEALVTFEHELRKNFSVSATYIYKKVHDQQTTFNQGVSSHDYIPVDFTRTCGNASCDAASYSGTYYRLPYQLPTALLLRNYDFVRGYHGVEFVARRRMSDRWMMQGSVVLNDTRIHYENDRAYQDPTNVSLRDNEQTGTLNTRWVAKLSAAYDLPWGVTMAGFFNARDGVPFVRSILAEARGNGLADIEVQLDPYGDSRYENFYQLDLRFSKTVNLFGTHRISGYADVFNLFNSNYVLTREDQQQRTTANNVQEVLAARVLRIGVKYQF